MWLNSQPHDTVKEGIWQKTVKLKIHQKWKKTKHSWNLLDPPAQLYAITNSNFQNHLFLLIHQFVQALKSKWYWSSLPPITPRQPFSQPGSAGGFFLLKRSFSFPLSPRCLLTGALSDWFSLYYCSSSTLKWLVIWCYINKNELKIKSLSWEFSDLPFYKQEYNNKIIKHIFQSRRQIKAICLNSCRKKNALFNV